MLIEEYIRRIREMPEDIIQPGKVTMLTVSHDDGCPCADGTRPITSCTCDPDIEYVIHE